ncbi:MAG: redoxin domain-containing protein [Acidobacteria bacterium]|nr:redoxin domain-containing protein [Acidobacteriota bacterium]
MRRLCVLAAALAVAAFGAGGALDVAPPFELPGSDGNTHTLAQYEGRTVVLAWFLKAFTGG